MTGAVYAVRLTERGIPASFSEGFGNARQPVRRFRRISLLTRSRNYGGRTRTQRREIHRSERELSTTEVEESAIASAPVIGRRL